MSKSRIAKNLVAQRQALSWTQEQLATAAGINPETVSRYERGVSLPTIEALERLAIALNTELAVLVATPSSISPDDAKLVSVWLQGLTAEDRSFVTTLIQSAAQHLKRRRAAT
jgi:transcriptional regulator with XRE-family HTH domain